MADFYMTLPAEEISRQVAELLNTHNQLRKHHTPRTLKMARGAYFVDIIAGQVIGCSAIHQENAQLTRQFHLCVHPDWRRRGIARKLKLASLAHVTTPYVYVTIREDNIPSIRLSTSLGFVLVKKDWAGDHHIITLGRMMIDGRQESSPVDFSEQCAIEQSPEVRVHGQLFLTRGQ